MKNFIKSFLICSCLVFLFGAAKCENDNGITPPKGGMGVYDRVLDLLLWENFDGKEKKDIPGDQMDGYFCVDPNSQKELIRYNKDLEDALRACRNGN